MKRIISAILAAALCVLSLTACSNDEEFSDSEKLLKKYSRSDDATKTYNYSDGATEPPNAYNNYAAAVTEFSLKELSEISKDSGESFVFSPASSALQLVMLANAASPDIPQDILLGFGGTLGIDDLNPCSSYFMSRMEAVSKSGDKTDACVKLGGALLVDNSLDVKTAFLQNIKDFFGYDVLRYKFSGENASKKLKNYLKSYTSNSGISPDGDTADLVGATKISDAWLDGYYSDAETDVFKGSDGEEEMDFYSSNEIKIHTDKAQGVIKYTAKNPLKLVLVMPDEGTSIDDYLKSFNSQEYNDLLSSVDVTKRTTAVIPEFSVKSRSEAYELSEPLSNCGFSSVFSGKAGLSALSFKEGACFGEMYEVRPDFVFDKDGINSGKLKPENDGEELQKTDDSVIFDRPFIFMLIDNESNIPVQMGIYR